MIAVETIYCPVSTFYHKILVLPSFQLLPFFFLSVKKKFDFFVKKGKTVYAIETNFYSSSGSKLNETARSYKTIALESKEIDGFAFVWVTDGCGWHSARHNLEETFDVLDNMYCIADLENNIMESLFD